MLAGFWLVVLAMGVIWLLREPLHVAFAIASAHVSVHINYWRTVHGMRRAARRWRRGL